MTAIRALAFGDLESGLWGAAWIPASPSPAPVVLGAGSRATVVPATLEGDDGAEQWRLDSNGAAQLTLSPSGAAVTTGEPRAGTEGFDQLCRVAGRFTLGDDEHSVDCLGWRAVRDEPLDPARLGSFRQVSAWFEPGEGLALVAIRPRKARGQEADELAAAVLDSGHPTPVADPRLSTTYTVAGRPARAGLEFWVDAPESNTGDEPDGNEPPAERIPQQHPRRAAGETLGVHADWSVDGLELHAELFRWHSRGRDGAGVYLLGLPKA